uniref:Choline transporter-like protein n=1 Tax=Cryptomonas curvata TaxID=233186 RepID=A0A7S0MMB4_9CRYP|mmetsp:Transcript_48385/g.101082  ORF Transcript_48385/g.101082 Transcript_48385/m.101082 type:complete len:373 (+) Transcript_48385:791-1909(+)
MIIAGAVSQWYWLDKEDCQSLAALYSTGRLLRFQLGIAAVGAVVAPVSWIMAFLPIFCCPLWRVNRVSVKELSSMRKGGPSSFMHWQQGWMFRVSSRWALALAATRNEGLRETFQQAAALLEQQAGLISAITSALFALLHFGRTLSAATCAVCAWTALRAGLCRGVVSCEAGGNATLCAAALAGWLGANIPLSSLSPAVDVLLLAACDDATAAALDDVPAPVLAEFLAGSDQFGTPDITTPCRHSVSLAGCRPTNNTNQCLSLDDCPATDAPPSASGSATLMVADDATPTQKARSWLTTAVQVAGDAEPSGTADHAQLEDTRRRVPRRLFENSAVVLAWTENSTSATSLPPLASPTSSVPPSLPSSGLSSPR